MMGWQAKRKGERRAGWKVKRKGAKVKWRTMRWSKRKLQALRMSQE